jgi:hypothetical protein
MKLTTDRPYADPEAAARKVVELAHAFEPVQDGRIYIDKINGRFIDQAGNSPAEYTPGLKLAIARGRLELHESGTFVKLTQTGKDLFARHSFS